MARIFISYRRDDAGYVASMLREHLEEAFGAGSVFMDVDNIPLGEDFRQHLSNAVSTCDVLLALIGETWAGPLPGRPERRIDDAQDFVRIEVESALKRGIPVVPVLIDKAPMPAVDSLPPSLRELSFRNAAELRAGRDLKAHLNTLVQGLRSHVGRRSADAAEGGAPSGPAPVSGPPAMAAKPASAPAPAPTPAPMPAPAPAPAAAAPERSRMTLVAGAAALAVAAGAGWWFTRPSGAGSPAPVPGLAVGGTAPAPAITGAGSGAPVVTGSAAPASTPPAPPLGPVRAPAPAAAPAAQAPPGPAPVAVGDASLLQNVKVAVFFPSGDTTAGQTARGIVELFRQRGAPRVELRAATAERLRELIPPEGLEVRYDEGREEAQARLLNGWLAGPPLRRAATLKPIVSTDPTPNFISVFVPAGG
jgi:hypothetical protein